MNEMEFSFYSAYLNADKINFERSCETNAKIRYRGFDAFPKFSSNRKRIIYAAIRVYEAHNSSGAWLLNGFFGWE